MNKIKNKYFLYILLYFSCNFVNYVIKILIIWLNDYIFSNILLLKI